MLLILSVEVPACCCCCCCTFVGWNKYQGTEGCDRAVPMSGKGMLEPHGAQGGARDRLGGLALWDGITGCPGAGRPGMVGLVLG